MVYACCSVSKLTHGSFYCKQGMLSENMQSSLYCMCTNKVTNRRNYTTSFCGIWNSLQLPVSNTHLLYHRTRVKWRIYRNLRTEKPASLFVHGNVYTKMLFSVYSASAPPALKIAFTLSVWPNLSISSLLSDSLSSQLCNETPELLVLLPTLALSKVHEVLTIWDNNSRTAAFHY